MENLRLRESHRTAIKKELLTQKFDSREKTIKARREALALAVYNRKYSDAERRQMNRLPDGWLPTVKTIRARLGGIDFGEPLAKEKAVRVPASHKEQYGDYSTFLIALPHDDALSKEMAEIRSEERAIESEREKLSREIISVLYSVSTTNKLVTAWPEITRLVNKVCKTEAINENLPVVKVAELNRSLGLIAA